MARYPQLVAFVPAQKSLAMTPARQQEMTALLARESAEAKIGLPAGFHAVQAKAVTREGGHKDGMTVPRHQAQRCATSVAVKTAAAFENSRRIAKADRIGDRVNPGVGQQWVVLAAWEEVQTVSRTSSTMTDYDGSAATGVAGDKAAQTQRNDGKTAEQATNGLPIQASSRCTITQLILRVVPANSNLVQSAETMRGGWFVIQL